MPSGTRQKRSPFTRPARQVLVLAAVVAGLLAAVPAANAATFCVGAPQGCTGIAKPGDGSGLQAALDEASANADDDEVRIGPGTYSPPDPGGFDVVSPADGIVVSGSGSDQTILEGHGPSAVTFNFTGATGDSSKLRRVALRLSGDGGSPIGLLISRAGTSGVLVTAPAGVTAGLGVRMAADSVLGSTRVITPGLTGIETIGSGASVVGSFIAADIGVTATGGSLTVLNSRIATALVGILSRVPAELRDSLVHVKGGEFGVVSNDAMIATQMTIAGTDGAQGGVLAYGQDGGSASVALVNSIVTGFESDLSAGADALGGASVSTSYSSYASKDALPGGSINEGTGNLQVDPSFVDPGRADFRLRHDSSLIDMGDDVVFPWETDLDDELRAVDGDGLGGPRADLGAYEYQRRAPTAAITGPDTGTAGEALELSAAGSTDPDRGDDLAYSWTFGDGAAASSATAAHAYAAPGTYNVTLVVTDPTGLQAIASRLVAVQAPAGGGIAGGGPNGDTTAPVIGRLRTARMGRAIRFRLSEPARVTLRLGRVRSRRFAGRIRVSGRGGANVVRIPRRLARVLEPGRYRVKATARDTAGNLARPRVARLVLLRRAA